MDNSDNLDWKIHVKQTIRSVLPPSLRHIRSKIRLINQADLYRESHRNRWIRASKFMITELCGNDIRFKSPDGMSYISMPNNYSSFVTCVIGARDPEIWRFITKTLKSGSVFVDAGANIGTYTLPVSQLLGTEGRVFSFEAHPRTFAYLAKNLEINQIENVIAINLALGDRCGLISIKFNSNNPGETHVSDKNDLTTDVELTTIDSKLKQYNIDSVDYLKIDVEGFELQVIRGAKDTLLRNQKIIVQTELEERHAARYGHQISEVCDTLKSFEFSPFKIDKNGNAQRAENDLSGDVIWMRN